MEITVGSKWIYRKTGETVEVTVIRNDKVVDYKFIESFIENYDNYGEFLREFDPASEPVVGFDNVNNPQHYTNSQVECIDAIRAALTDEEFRGFCKGNVLKYTWREKHKGGNESLEKAVWYLKQMVGE